jgi:hypothetical protein
MAYSFERKSVRKRFIKKGDVKQLAEMLKVNCSLTSFILAGCNLNDDAVKGLVDALKNSNTSLIRIDLSHNPQVTVESAQMLLDLVQAGRHIPLQRLCQVLKMPRQISGVQQTVQSESQNTSGVRTLPHSCIINAHFMRKTLLN